MLPCQRHEQVNRKDSGWATCSSRTLTYECTLPTPYYLQTIGRDLDIPNQLFPTLFSLILNCSRTLFSPKPIFNLSGKREEEKEVFGILYSSCVACTRQREVPFPCTPVLLIIPVPLSRLSFPPLPQPDKFPPFQLPPLRAHSRSSSQADTRIESQHSSPVRELGVEIDGGAATVARVSHETRQPSIQRGGERLPITRRTV